ILAVDHFAHALDEKTFCIALEDGIPFAAPENLDDIPAGAPECGFKFLNDLSIAAYGPIEALQIAIDDEDEVVELFSGRKRDRAERFGLVGFAIAEERPNFCIRFWLQAACFEVTCKARIVNRHQGAQSHSNSWKFPEIRHQPRVWI